MTFRAVFLATPVLALGLACSGMGGARGSQTTTASNSGGATTSDPHANAQTIMGRVSEATGDQLVIETPDGRRETLSVHQETAVTIDGQVGRASDLQPGQMVRASYDDKAGQKSALTIQAGHHGMGGSTGMGGQAGDTGSSSSGTYQTPGTGSTGTGSTDTGSPQAGDTGTGAEDDTYQAPGTTGTGSTGTGSSDTGSTKPQAGDTDSSTGSGTYQAPGTTGSGSTGSSGSSSSGGKW